MRSWMIVILLMMFCFAAGLSALEINSISDRVTANLQNFDADGKGICPDSVWLEVINPLTGVTLYSAWGDSTDSWVTRKIGPNDSDTSYYVNPVMDDMDSGVSLDAYSVKFGAYDLSESDYVYVHIYVQVNRGVGIKTDGLTAAGIADDAIDYATFAGTAPGAWWNEGKTGYAATVSDKTGFSLSPNQTFNLTGDITGNMSGSVGGVAGNVTGSVNLVTLPVTVGDASPGAFVAADYNTDFFTAIYDKMIDGDNELPFRAVGFSTHSAADVYNYFISGSNEDAFRGLLGDTTQTLAQELHWLILYTGAEPGTVIHLKPFGASPKTSQEIPGETYKVEWFPNDVNPEVIDSGGVSE